MLSLSECIPWMTVVLAECVAIVTLNLCTIIIFFRNRNLRKRSTYLVINLAVIDMLVGGFAVYDLYDRIGAICNVWKAKSIEDWAGYILQTLLDLFLYGSPLNIAIIALERLHATFYPFRHRVLKNWVYGVIIAIGWVTSGLVAITNTLLLNFRGPYHYFVMMCTFFSICLLIICVSYTSIVIKVRCGAQSQHHGAASRERKLTVTLLIVTVISLLLILPYVIFTLLIFYRMDLWRSLSPLVLFQLHYAVAVLFYANSLVNPILYVIRIPEYRSALLALFRNRPQQQRQAAVFPLRDM